MPLSLPGLFILDDSSSIAYSPFLERRLAGRFTYGYSLPGGKTGIRRL